MAAEPPAGGRAGAGKEGAGAALHLGADVVVLFLAALERGVQILLHLNGLEGVAVGGADAKDDPVAEPEQKNSHSQDFGEELEPAERFADERVRRNPLQAFGNRSRPGTRCVLHGKLIPYKS